MISARAWLLASAALLPAALVQPAQAAIHRFHEDHVLGTSMDLVVVGADAAESARALAAARAEIARLDRVLSGWRPDSELAALNASDGPMAVSQDLYRVIERCEAFHAASGGAFSARLGRVEAVWRAAERAGAPDGDSLRRAADQARRAPVRLDPAARAIDRGGVLFAVDALAKGYVIDSALAAAARAAPQAQGLMLDIGGDLRCMGAAPGREGWRIGLQGGADADNAAPAHVIRLADGAAATSGPGARGRIVDGRRVNHTLSPADGRPAPSRTVTVLAPTATDADALATALSVMPTRRGLALAARFGARARIVEADGRAKTTDDWADLAAPAPIPARPAQTAAARLIRTAGPARAAPWPGGFEVAIDYEVAYVPAGRYRPPFVAIWISDDQGKAVRTLFHLGNRPHRYLDSNYVWWRAFDADGMGQDRLATVTRPSREPGKYTAVWDGKDDAGNLVDQGRYVINIEMTREHGGHSLQTIPLDLGKAPASGAAPGQGESGPAAARYGRPAI